MHGPDGTWTNQRRAAQGKQAAAAENPSIHPALRITRDTKVFFYRGKTIIGREAEEEDGVS